MLSSKTMKKNRIFPVLILVTVLAAVYFCFFYSEKAQYLSYKDFWQSVEASQVSSVQFDGEKLYWTAEADGKDFEYYTDNPNSPVLQEELMRKGILVTVSKDTTEVISLIFDILFYIIFFGMIVLAFRKFISPNTFKVVRKTGVSFDDVVGMESLKRDMQTIMQIMKSPSQFAKKGIRMPKGILLEGEPGNGKTLFAKALAGEAKVNFIPAKATDFESMFMAIGPMKVKLLFRKARRRAPCIVFIDEFDGIGTRRNYSGSAIETENTRIVTALLNELDGFEPTQGVLVMAATNSIQALDEALIRPGRFDARFKVPYPDEAARIQLSELYTRNKPHSPECTPQVLAAMFKGFSCAKIESVLNKAAMLATQRAAGESQPLATETKGTATARGTAAETRGTAAVQTTSLFTLDDIKQAIKEVE